jgi:hypothetical protein
VRQYIPAADDLASVRNSFRKRRSGPVQAVHGLTTDFERALDSGTSLLVREILLETTLEGPAILNFTGAEAGRAADGRSVRTMSPRTAQKGRARSEP